MFYIMTHSTHFIYGYFIYGVRHMVKEHSDSEKRNPQQKFFYMHHPTDRITHTTAFVTPVVAGTRNSSMGPPHEGSIRRLITP